MNSSDFSYTVADTTSHGKQSNFFPDFSFHSRCVKDKETSKKRQCKGWTTKGESWLFCVRLLPSLFLLHYDCGNAFHWLWSRKKTLFFPCTFCGFLSGFLLGSCWRARFALDFTGRKNSFYNQHLSYVPYHWSIPLEAHNNFFPVLFLKTSLFVWVFFTKSTVKTQNQTIFKDDRKGTKWPNLAKQSSDC